MAKRRIPKGHILEVCLAILKDRKDTNQLLVEDLAKIAAEYKGRDRVWDAHTERKRVEAQRALFAALPEFGPGNVAAEALKKAMIDRAWKLLDIGQAEACDALLEFVPEADADKMLDEYFNEPDEAKG